MVMALNLHLLRLFAAVAEHGGFSRAAEALCISQPAVSRGVREFEAQVEGRLLERGPGGVTLTEAFQIVPEQSTAALIMHHPRAAYFNAAAIRELAAS